MQASNVILSFIDVELIISSNMDFANVSYQAVLK